MSEVRAGTVLCDHAMRAVAHWNVCECDVLLRYVRQGNALPLCIKPALGELSLCGADGRDDQVRPAIEHSRQPGLNVNLDLRVAPAARLHRHVDRSACYCTGEIYLALLSSEAAAGDDVVVVFRVLREDDS